MNQRYTATLLLLFFSISLLMPPVAQAQRYNNYYAQQSMQRQQQMMAQQRQQQMMAQQRQQQQMRQQQMRQQQMRQQEMMRQRQREMQRQMQARQQRAMQQRQQMQQRQRQIQQQRQQQLSKQRKTQQQQKAKGQQQAIAKQQRAAMQQTQLRQQRQMRDRQNRLKQLKQKRLRQDQNQKQRQKAQKNSATMASLALQRQARLNAVRSNQQMKNQPKNLNQLKQKRLQQKQRQKATKLLQKQRQTAQQRMKKVKLAQQKLQLKRKLDKQKQDRLKKTQGQAKSQFACKGNSCGVGGSCSFHGDTLVLTQDGFKPIRTIQSSIDTVLARDEHTGETDWKRVTSHYSNLYDYSVDVTVVDENTKQKQVITSNRIHPFFVPNEKAKLLSNVSYSNDNKYGTNTTGNWVEAADLRSGDKLFHADGSLSAVQSVSITPTPLKAFNLTIDDFHTYFIKGASNDNASAVWVHNDCDSEHDSRNSALRAAKRDLGIPRSATPTVVREKLMENGKPVLDRNGQPITTRNYVYKSSRYGKVAIQEHSKGHPRFKGNPAGNPHFNIRKYHGIDKKSGRIETSNISGKSGHYMYNINNKNKEK